MVKTNYLDEMAEHLISWVDNQLEAELEKILIQGAARGPQNRDL